MGRPSLKPGLLKVVAGAPEIGTGIVGSPPGCLVNIMS